MSRWNELFVPDPILQALRGLGFSGPTPIQALTLPAAIRDRLDIVGAAETGSGKTLAYGIPILAHILNSKEETERSETVDHTELCDEDLHSECDVSSDDGSVGEDGSGEEDCDFPLRTDETDDTMPYIDSKERMLALILTPTRELAVQVSNHLRTAAKYTDIKVATIVGGMSQEKQERILRKHPEIVVATPGRLWELIQLGNPHLSTVKDVSYLVIDEADRIVEKGHFLETKKLLEMINGDEGKKEKRQTFVFSATLTFVHSGPDRVIKKSKKTVGQKLDMLVNDVGIKPKHKVVDLTTKTAVAETLKEMRVSCLKSEKDFYLYYFLLTHPGRTLVFANSKDCIRRLISLFTLLGCNPLPLHAEMHQKQRLKNLERFSDNDKGLLLATDVAARGLDIPNVQHVIHYQVPRTSENYIHRSGRTARATKSGLSVLLIGEEDSHFYRRIASTLKRTADLPIMMADEDYMPTVRDRVSLAREVDIESYRSSKEKRKNDWFLKAAEDVDIELDETMLNNLGSQREQAQRKNKLRSLKDELTRLLQQPVLPQSYSGKYLTKTGKLVGSIPSRKV